MRRFPADHLEEMRGRTTVWMVATVLAVALTATTGITLLHRHARESRARYETLIEVEASANRLSMLDWKATALRRVPLPVEAEVNATLPQMRTQLVGLLQDGGERIQGPL